MIIVVYQIMSSNLWISIYEFFKVFVLANNPFGYDVIISNASHGHQRGRIGVRKPSYLLGFLVVFIFQIEIRKDFLNFTVVPPDNDLDYVLFTWIKGNIISKKEMGWCY